jgi:hypothetical protein
VAEGLDYVVVTVLIGAGATAFLDFSALAQTWLLGAPLQGYGLVGRWLGHMAHGQFRHEAIAASPPVRGERSIGWAAHYLTGIAFAAVLIAGWGLDWVRQPTLAPALIVGLGSALVPFLVMQPGMGFGIAAGRTPDPWARRRRTLIAHGTFAIGLYAAGLAASLLVR